jgi:replication-associated recombination protein RarA
LSIHYEIFFLKFKKRIFVLEGLGLTDENVMDILDRAIEKLIPHQLPHNSFILSTKIIHGVDKFYYGLIDPIRLTPKIKRFIASLSDGDAQTALSLLKLVFFSPPTASEESLLANLRQSVSTRYDCTGHDFCATGVSAW